MKPIPHSHRKVGRPLSFDRQAALHKAMIVFWRHGYEATSLSLLTKAMGLTPPSIYAAYGDKKALFLETIRSYLAPPADPHQIVAAAGTARAAAWALLEGAAYAFTGEDTPPGCLLASSAIACSPEAADVREELASIRNGVEDRLRAKIATAVESGELDAMVDADAPGRARDGGHTGHVHPGARRSYAGQADAHRSRGYGALAGSGRSSLSGLKISTALRIAASFATGVKSACTWLELQRNLRGVGIKRSL